MKLKVELLGFRLLSVKRHFQETDLRKNSLFNEMFSYSDWQVESVLITQIHLLTVDNT